MEANFTQDKTVAIKCRQGYPLRISAVFKTDAGVVIDVSLYSWTFQISTNYADQGGLEITSISQVANANGEVITVDAGTGTVAFEVKAISTNKIKALSSFVWELRGSLAGVPELGLDGTVTARAKVIA